MKAAHFLLFGPRGTQGERTSAYRMRWAAYSLRWTVALGLPLAVLLALRPNAAAFPAPYAIFFLYIGLPLGTATAALAMAGFFIGALWSRLLERHPGLARAWPRAKDALLALALLPLNAFLAWSIARAVTRGEVTVPKRHGPRVTFSAADEPTGFAITLGVLVAAALVILWYQYKLVRGAYRDHALPHPP